MSTLRRFSQLDVFTTVPLMGNPLAVVHGADGLDEARMAAVARWTHLSETTFLLAPDDPEADYRVRIFTPAGELPFAGHPTLGSCHAWLAAGGQPRTPGVVVQQCGVGRVRVRRDGSRLAFAAPPLRRSGAADAGPDGAALKARVAAALCLPAEALLRLQWVDNGPGWLAVMLADAEAVRAVRPDPQALGTMKLGLVGAHPPGSACAIEVRAFFPDGGVGEDPVTGSLNAGLAQWLIGEGLLPPRYVAAQGAALGRDGRVHIERLGDDIWVGGAVCDVVQGQIAL